MTGFDLLLLINLVGALLALRRLRPALFVIAGNQILVLQAFRHISEYGQPDSEYLNPGYIYSAAHLATALGLFTFTTALLLAAILVPSFSVLPRHPSVPPVPRWGLWLLAAFLALITLSSKTILTISRMDPGATVSSTGRNISGSGLASLFYGVLLYELYRRVSTRALRPLSALGLLFAVFTFTEFLKGQTGIATGFLVCASVFFLGAIERVRDTLSVRREVFLGIIILALTFFASAVRYARELIPEEGLGALLDLRWATESSATTNRTAEGIESAGNGSSYAAHVLECITLYERGVSREWRSFSDPLIFTFEPTFLQSSLGLSRPINAAQEIQRYFVSGGGAYTIGELYWNGGYASLALGYFLILLWAWLCDTRYRRSAVWLAFSCQFTPQLVQAIGYGFSQVFRGFFNGLLLVAIYLALRRVLARRSPRRRWPSPRELEVTSRSQLTTPTLPPGQLNRST